MIYNYVMLNVIINYVLQEFGGLNQHSY